MKQTILLALGCLMMTSGAWATDYTLTLYADGCDAPNLIYCPSEQQLSVSATPMEHRHFVKWNDGNTDNPRLVTLNQNLTYTASFAPDSFNVSLAASPAVYGSVSGAGRYQYNDPAILTATPNYGYKFSRWSDGNTDNPRTIYVTSDCSFQAIFTKKQFNLQGMTTDDSQGYVSGGGSFFYQDSVTIKANSYVGYAFRQWNDGSVENPRTIYLVSDTAFTASFYQLYEGKCGDNLSWKYADNTLTITGTGAMYDYTSSTMPWFLFCDSITKIIIPDGCTSIGNYAFSDCNNIKSVTWNAKNCNSYNFGSQVETFVFGDSVEVIPANICENMTQLDTMTIPSSVQSIGNNAFKNCTGISELNVNNGVTAIGDSAFYGLSDKNLKTITLPNSVETIGKYAFAYCTYLKTITLGAKLEDINEYAFKNDDRLLYVNCYAEEPPLLQENAFDNYDIYLQVPCEVLDEYKVAKGWKLFNKANVSCLSAEGKTVTSDQITVTPSANDATFTWPANDAADCYNLEITKDGAVFCTLKFNAQGQLIGIAFAPGRNGNHHAPAAVMTTNGWQFTVTGLNAASHYNYTLDVTDAGKQVIKSYKGEFATDGYTDLLSLPYEGNASRVTKFFQNGQLYILRDGIMYDARGVRIE